MKTFIITASLLFIFFTGSVFADEIEDLTAVKQQLNFQLVKMAGQDELNNRLIQEAGGRAFTLKQNMTKLQRRLAEVNRAIKKIEAAAIQEKLEPIKTE